MPITNLVPIHLDGIYIPEEKIVTLAPPVDFKKLDRLINKDQAYLGENLTNEAFSIAQGDNRLDKGIHLHWSLPDALTKSMGLPLLSLQSFHNAFGTVVGKNIWDTLEKGGWISLLPHYPNTAKLAPPNQRDQKVLRPFDPSEIDNINALLNRHVYPAAPNRWLITRFKTNSTTPDKQWILESDYVWADKNGSDNHQNPLSKGYTPFPVLGSNKEDEIDYNYIGRWYELGQKVDPSTTTLLEPLTAIGFGEPTFAALYGNCRNVFGFQDPDAVTTADYEVIGWFSDSNLDYYNLFKDDFLENHLGNYPYTQLLGALKTEFAWFIPIQVKQSDFSTADWELMKTNNWLESMTGGSAVLSTTVQQTSNTLGVGNEKAEESIRDLLDGMIKDQLPAQSFFYARCEVGTAQANQASLDDVTLAIGNTGAEALSALMAKQLSPAKKQIIEDYLEAQQLSQGLQDKATDLGPKFEEARHQNGFTAVPGGNIWTIRNQNSSNKKASHSKVGEEITLPDVLADLLNELNLVQQQGDQTQFELESLQQQIFTDWCTYLKLEAAVENAGSADGGPGDQDGPGDPGDGPGGFDGSGDGPGGFDDPGDFDDGPGGQDGPRDYGGPGGQDGPGGPNDGPGNQEGGIDPHLEEYLGKLRTYINWEIDVVLKGKLEDLNNSQLQLQALNDKLDLGLALFQTEQQYLQVDDISDWPTFEKTIKGLSLPAFQALDFTQAKLDIVQSINQKVLDDSQLWSKLNYNTNRISPEALELLKEKNTDAWLPELYLRFNRLLLESLLPIIHQPRLIKQSIAAPRYWMPNEPSLLISGIQPTVRHGQDGRLRDDKLLACSSMDLAGTPAEPNNYAKLLQALENVKQTEPENFALYPDSNNWHPILMDWSINFTPTQIGNAKDGKDADAYPASYLNDHFQLPLNAVDFDKQLAGLGGADIPFSSRSILTPSGSQLQKNKLVQNLLGDILLAIKKNLQTESLSKQAFIDWVNKDAAKDEALKALISQPIYVKTSDSQQIVDWLKTHLHENNKENALVSWYWQELKTTIYPSPYVLPDSSGSSMDQFVDWVYDRLHLKKTFYQEKKVPDEKQSDFELQYDQSLGFPAWLKNIIGPEIKQYFKVKNLQFPASDENLLDYLAQNFNPIISWYQGFVRGMMHSVFNYHAYSLAYQVNGLSQALGGFNKVMSNLSQTYQLNIADPIANKSEDTAFTQKVRAAIQQHNDYSAFSAGDYAPYRAGKMTLNKLQLIDTFGRVWPSQDDQIIESASLVCTEGMSGTPDTKDIYLPPRLVHPARLNFRWLSAHSSFLEDDTSGQDLIEMNSHPATSPICGWVLPNNLDNSLMIYHQNGQALGYIDESGRWRVFPGHAGPVTPTDISNPHLSAMVQRLCRITQTQTSSSTSYIADFIQVLDSATDNIAPDNSAQHDALSLLIGKPLALVRSSLSLSQRGLSNPFKRSGIDDLPGFRNELNRFIDLQKKGPIPADGFKWNTNEYERVKVPLRIGEYRQLNDGLAGYWIDDAPEGTQSDALNQDVFYAPQSFNPDNQQPLIQTHDEKGNPFLMQLSFSQDKPIQLSMLVDPKGKVHATCGILPVKDIHIPPDQYRTALNRMEVAFLSAPLLSLPERLHISLPPEPGYGWSWIEKEGQSWRVINSTGQIQLADFERVFAQQASAIWGQLEQKGWLTNIDNGHADVVPKDQRQETLDKAYLPLQAKIEMMLESTQINSFDANASFSGKSVIREGWLKLSKSNF